MSRTEGKAGPAQARGGREEQRQAQGQTDEEQGQGVLGERGVEVEDGAAAEPKQGESSPPGCAEQ